jgi:hypothetical protein
LTRKGRAGSSPAIGKTVDQVIVSVPVSAFSQTNQAQFYVSMSRARASMHLFTDSKAALKEAVMRSSERLSPYEFISKNGNGRYLVAFVTAIHRACVPGRNSVTQREAAERRSSKQKEKWKDELRQIVLGGELFLSALPASMSNRSPDGSVYDKISTPLVAS